MSRRSGNALPKPHFLQFCLVQSFKVFPKEYYNPYTYASIVQKIFVVFVMIQSFHYVFICEEETLWPIAGINVCSARPKPLFWFRSDTETQIGQYFWIIFLISGFFEAYKKLHKWEKFRKKKFWFRKGKIRLQNRYWNWTLVLVPEFWSCTIPLLETWQPILPYW